MAPPNWPTPPASGPEQTKVVPATQANAAPEGKATVTSSDPQKSRPELRIDTTIASPARIWNYWVGGKDHFAADREAGEQVIAAVPYLPQMARHTRQFLISAVRQLATDFGIRQFLDIGTGLPTADNTHEVAQQVAPQSRVVYVDNDPIVLAHARALLTSSPEGKTDYIDADLRDVDAIVDGAGQRLDLSQPVAVLLIAILHFIPDTDDPYRIVARLMDAVPSGSYLAIVHGANDIQTKAVTAGMRLYNEASSTPIRLRNRAEVTRFFDGLEPVGPGMVPIGEWWPPGQIDPGALGTLASYAGIARKK